MVIVLIPPLVLPLWVPLRDKTEPALWGVPFFQLLLVVVSAVLTLLAFVLAEVADRRNRRRGQV
jgi:hypothetical protein